MLLRLAEQLVDIGTSHNRITIAVMLVLTVVMFDSGFDRRSETSGGGKRD